MIRTYLELQQRNSLLLNSLTGKRKPEEHEAIAEPGSKRRRRCLPISATHEEVATSAHVTPEETSTAIVDGDESLDSIIQDKGISVRIVQSASEGNQATLQTRISRQTSTAEQDSDKVTVACWNVGGMYKNHPEIFDRCKHVDIACFVETFLENETAPHLRIPDDSHALFVPGKRGPQSRRASGGFAVLVKNNVAKPANCDLRDRFPGIAVASIRLTTGVLLRIVLVYRAATEGTPLFNSDFYVNLMETLADYADDNLIVLGDFNTKLGDMQGPLGILDFAGDILPQRAESTEVDRHAEDLFEVLTSAQLYALHDDSSGLVKDTCLARDDSGGGSLIDMFLVNDHLYPYVSNLSCSFGLVSDHAILVAQLDLEVLRDQASNTVPRPKSVRLFDIARLSDLEHTEGITALANSPDDFDIRGGLEVILDYVQQFTQVVPMRTQQQHTGESAATKAAKRDARLVERRMRVERDQELRRAYRVEWLRTCEYWRECRDYDAQRTIEESRRNFFDAVANKNLYRAWKIARRNLAGKGGGIRDKVTSFISQNEWEDHFSGLFSGAGATLRAPRSGIRCRILDEPFSGDEVCSILERKKNHRALGPDGFSLDHIRILRYDEVTCRALANFLNLCVAEADIPDEWGRAFLFILYKGTGPKDNANSFRGITLKSQLLKLLESLMCERLRQWAELKRLLPAEQLAYRPGHNGSDHLYSLALLREQARARGQKLHAAFIDLKKAFPSVDRQQLLNKLSRMGVSDCFLSMLTRLYSGDSFSILLDGVSSTRTFQVNQGVHEGSPLSPLLFILFIADLAEELRREAGNHGVRLNCGAVIFCLLYADDVLLVSLTRLGLQTLIDRTCAFFSQSGLTVNPDKSDIVVFCSDRRQAPVDFRISGLAKEEIAEAKYLGLIFNHDGRWKTQLETTLTRCRMAKGRCHIICATLGVNRSKPMTQVFDMFLSSIYRYSLGVWGITAGDLSRIDNLFCDFVRKQYSLPQSTCRKGILMQFARRCASCDAYYLATVQLTRALTSPTSVWGRVLATAWTDNAISWVRNLRTRLRLMGIEDEVIRSPGSFLSNRRDWGITFSKWCHERHLRIANGSSADLFRVERPFGMYPFLFDLPVARVRTALTFLLSCWKWSFGFRNVSEYCSECDCLINSSHLLFRCIHTQAIRDDFQRATGEEFSLDNFSEVTLNNEIVSACDQILCVVRQRFVQ